MTETMGMIELLVLGSAIALNQVGSVAGNILNLVHNAVAADVMVLPVKSGFDPKIIHEVISNTGSSSAMFENHGGRSL